MEEEEPPPFELDQAGSLTLFPMVTCRTALCLGMTCALRIEYQPSPDRNAPLQAIQLALTPEQATALARLLDELAQQAQVPPVLETRLS